jgi:surface protein
MEAMFWDCNILPKIENVSNFNTSNATNMNGMFYNCYALTSLDLSSFDTSKVTKMSSMFYNCYALTSLDLSNFDTSKATYTINMFSGCAALTTLDLSNFDTSNSVRAGNEFSGCDSLTTLRLDNCNNTTINKLITNGDFPTEAISGKTRRIYCKRANAAGLTPPTNWVFSYID